MDIYLNGKEIEIPVKKVGKGSFGLMFKFNSERADNLLFEFKKGTGLAITSLFVFFPFLAVWLDEKNRVLEVRKVGPFRSSISARKKFRKLVEIPLNRKNLDIIGFFRREKEKV